MHINKLCRICVLEISKNNEIQPLFDETNDCLERVKQIEECGGIKLKPLNEFPKYICTDCAASLNISYRFRSLCQASEASLLDYIVKYQLPLTKTDGQDISPENFDTKQFTESLNSSNEFPIDIATEAKDFITDGDFLEEFEYHNINISDSDSVSGVDDDNNKDVNEIEYDESKLKSKNVERNVRGKRGRPRNEKRKSKEVVDLDKLGKRCKKKAEDNEARIICEICGNIYSKRSLLNLHMRRHTSEKPYECEICGKNFACASQIARHIRVHTGEKPYVCRFCGRTFTDRSTHIKHERIHTNERPFQCKTCGKSFSYSNVLKNHMLTHTGEKPFICIPCNKTFSRKHQLDQHISTLTHQQTIKNDPYPAESSEEKEQISLNIINTDLS